MVARLGVKALAEDLVGWDMSGDKNPLGEARLGRLAAFLGKSALATLGGHLHEKSKEENEMGWRSPAIKEVFSRPPLSRPPLSAAPPRWDVLPRLHLGCVSADLHQNKTLRLGASLDRHAKGILLALRFGASKSVVKLCAGEALLEVEAERPTPSAVHGWCTLSHRPARVSVRAARASVRGMGREGAQSPIRDTLSYWASELAEITGCSS